MGLEWYGGGAKSIISIGTIKTIKQKKLMTKIKEDGFTLHKHLSHTFLYPGTRF